MERIVNGYLYPSVQPQVLRQTAPKLTYLSMFTYGVTPQGGLVQLEDRSLAEGAWAGGAGPLMVLAAMDEEGNFDSNLASQVLRDPAVRQNLVRSIVENVAGKGLAGVDFDFEFLYPEDAELYAALVRETKAALAAVDPWYTVMVALAPKTSDGQPGILYEGHDYRALGDAADYAFLMTYEWGYTFGPPMAVAPLPQVRRVIQYGLSRIPREKILMGIPNYGYDWTLPFVQGESRAEKIGNEEAELRAKRYGAAVQFDEESQSPYYRYRDAEGREHEVWFENRASIRAKLQLIPEYGLAGVSYWNLMEYFPVLWEEQEGLFGTKKLG
ncbi:MAG: glycoside hydrolase [Clostridiales bacterium]|nr:glycoside hydrolase [Clostridiales bacterium]